MKNSFFLLPLVVFVLFLGLLPQQVYAHERQLFQIGGHEYLFVVGSLNEPIMVDDRTGVDLRVLLADPADPTNSRAANAKPVEGLEKTLKVEISAGDKKRIFDLQPAFRDPGAYRAYFYPTIQTTYNYRFFGPINNIPVDLTFTCNPAGHPQVEDDKSLVKVSDQISRKFKAGAFGCPEGKAGVGFPESSMSIHDLNMKVKELEKLISEIRAKVK